MFPGLRQGPRALDPQCLVTLDVSGSCLLSAGALGASRCGSLRPLGSLLTRTCSSALGRRGLSPLLSVLHPAPSLPGDPRPPGAPPCATTGTSQGRELGGGGTQGTCSCLAGLAVLCRPMSGVFGAAVQCSAIYSRVCVCGGRDKSGPCASSCGPHRGVLRGTRSPVGGLPAARSCPCEAPSWHLALTGGVPVRWVTAGGPRGGPRPPPAPTAHAAGLVPGGWGPVWEARQPRAGWTRQPHWAPPGAQPPGDLPVWPAAPQHGSPGAPRDPVAFPRPVTAV